MVVHWRYARKIDRRAIDRRSLSTYARLESSLQMPFDLYDPLSAQCLLVIVDQCRDERKLLVLLTNHVCHVQYCCEHTFGNSNAENVSFTRGKGSHECRNSR
jgi:hypothetical protein